MNSVVYLLFLLLYFACHESSAIGLADKTCLRFRKMHESGMPLNVLGSIAPACGALPQGLVSGSSLNCSSFQSDGVCDCSCTSKVPNDGGKGCITCQNDQTWPANIPCCEPECPPLALLDIFFLLDSSSSTGIKNWKIIINFIVSLLDMFTIGPDDMRVGIARYNRKFDQKSEILINDYTGVDELKKKLKDIPYNGSGTLTGKALWHFHRESLNASGNRPGVLDILVVITDGKATDQVEIAAKAIKDRNVKIYAVGFSNRFDRMKKSQLSSISSGPGYVKNIAEGHQELARDLCA